VKSPLLVFALCAVFLLLSTGGTPQAPVRFKLNAESTAAGAGAPPTAAVSKAKSSRLPRWHRVIPGMFR
jgi:hypothetical protein